MNTKSATATPKIVAATALLGVAVLTVFAFGGSRQANAQATMPAAAAPMTSALALADGVDWSKVPVVPASPAQSVAAYDR